jgi:non-specific serine/threonine protein kinase/serine/threonine-protein kinase
VKSVLDALADLPASQRLNEAKRRLAGESELLERVIKMLRGLEEEEDFLEGNLPSLVGAQTITVSLGEARWPQRIHAAGTRISHFEIQDKLGEGGMAVVYEALQFEPVERTVALKVISAHATDKQRLRFERECATLARLSHPHVAAMYDSGISSGGELWVAMELVRGEPITDWCRKQETGIEQRLRLFMEACQGISHAHLKGVIHRDVKPSNLMVADIDGNAVVKVIDFGIAAALHPAAERQQDLTGRHLIGTPAYMSPEATYLMDHQALDARSDVYALGVVLYELICGRRPYDDEDLSLAGWMARLSSRESPPMWQLFGNLGAHERMRIATNRGCSLGSLERVMRSDLDLVVRKAMALEPEQRYAAPLDLANDLQHYLSGRAVGAHSPSPAYRARKFLRRHWMGSSATALLVLTIAGGIVAREMEVRQTHRALAESDAVSEFLVDLLEHASPLRFEGEEVMLQDIIDRGTEQLQEQFADQPAVQARLLRTLGRVYGERGDYERGAELLAQALERMSVAGDDDTLERIELHSDLGVALRRQGRADESEAVLIEGLALAEPIAGGHPLLTAELANDLGNVYVIRRDWRRAEEQHLKALSLREAHLPAGDGKITSSRNNLATVLINSWQLDRALPYAERVLAEWQASLPPQHPWIGIARNNLAIIFERLGRDEEAFALFREALGIAEVRLGPDHPDVADYWRNISVHLDELGRREEALEANQRHVDILKNALGPDAERTLAAERRLAIMYFDDGRPDLVLERLDRIQDRLVGGADDEGLVVVQLARARAMTELGDLRQAREVLDAQWDDILRVSGPNSSLEFQAIRFDASLTAAEGRPDEAIAKLEALEAHGREVLPPRSSAYGEIVMALATHEFGRGRADAAIGWAQAALAFWQETHRDIQTLNTRILLGRACFAADDLECAEENLVPAVQMFVDVYGADHPAVPELNLALARLAESEHSASKP